MAKIQKKKKIDVEKSLSNVHTRPIWTTFPKTIKFLQENRIPVKGDYKLYKINQRCRGMNATIMLLSACSIEGFMRQLLECFASRFEDKKTFQGRLSQNFLNKVTDSTFKDFVDLFQIATGRTIEEFINNKDLVEGVRTLIHLRNGIAHGQPAIYEAFGDPDDEDPDFQLGGQYKKAETYLHKHNLRYAIDDFFDDRTADHFAALVKPYIDAVHPILSEYKINDLQGEIRMAFREPFTISNIHASQIVE